MSIRSQLFRASSTLCLVLIAMGPVPVGAGNDDSKPSTKPISQNNRSSQSSRYGDRLQQMKQRSSSSSSSRSSSASRPSPSRTQSSTASRSSGSASSSSGSSSYDRSRSSSSSSYDRSRSSAGSTSRNPNTGASSYNRSSSSGSSSSLNRGATPSRPSTYNRSSSNQPSSSTSFNRSRSATPNNSSSYNRNRSSNPSSASSASRVRSSSATDRNQGAVRSNSYDRNRSGSSSSSFDRARSQSYTSPFSSSNERRSSSSYSSRTRTSPVVTPNIYDRSRTNSSAVTRTQTDRRDNNRDHGSLNRGSSSNNQNRDQRSSGRSYDRSDRNSVSYDRSNNSSDRYSHSRNSNHNRNKQFYSGAHNRYVFDYHRYKDSRHYNHNKFRTGAYCPYYDRLYHRSYYSRRYYSPAVFSTIILGAGVTSSVYNSYDSGNYTTYDSSEPFVELYEHSGFRGESLQVYSGEAVYNLKDIRFDSYKSFNDRFSSIKVYGEVTVVLYIDSDFGGDYIYLTGSHIDFGRDTYLRRFNDRISSLEVIPGIVHEADHRSRARDYLLNSHLLDASPFQEPVSSQAVYAAPAVNAAVPLPVTPPVNSVIHAQQARVILYDQANYQGNQIILTPGDAHVDLGRFSKGLAGTWNDCVASVRVEGNTELFIYCDPEFRGDGIAIRNSVPNLAVDGTLVPFANRVSSVVVNAVY